MSNANKKEEFNTISKVFVVFAVIGTVSSFFRFSSDLIKVLKS